jgi:DNA polymerase II small subunit/DNA polymerase delta subunit B
MNKSPCGYFDNSKSIFKYAVIGDMHIGSKYFDVSKLNSFFDELNEFQPDFILDAGDSVDGSFSMHKGKWKHQKHLGFSAQLSAYIKEYPNIGVKTYRINGNHDLSFLKYEKKDLAKEIIKIRKDIFHLGDNVADFFVNNTKIRLLHPNSGDYTGNFSKKLDLIVNNIVKDKPQLLHVNHYHKKFYNNHRDIHSFLNGTFQTCAHYWDFNEMPDIGSWLIKFEQDKTGKIVDLATKFVSL